ncbi:MAG: hypothetical protein RLZZ174_1654 [Pseudomonadota bacterium]
MKTTSLLLSTLKEVPADAEIISHRLMLRAGLIRRVAAGIYTWLPIGLRVLRKIEGLIRQEMDESGAREVLMPAVQPAELWEESGRWAHYGAELLRMEDRHQRPFCFGPTHEEVITDLVRRELRSYKQLPLNLYQIQTKFRDEIRPRFGVMRAREFIMKDAYSFHLTEESFEATYQTMHEAYSRILTRMELDFRPVLADTGNIGGAKSHEFHVLAESGEDLIAFSDRSSYAANVELAPALPPTTPRPAPRCALEAVSTPKARTIEALTQQLGVTARQCVKTLVVEGTEGPVALMLRGDHTLNAIKAAKLPGVADPLRLAPEAMVKDAGLVPGFIGPVALPIPFYVDHSAAALGDFVCGGGSLDTHYRGANWDRDCALPAERVVDLRNVEVGDASPDGEGTLQLRRGIEVGHIFQLGTKYAAALKATVQDAEGAPCTLTMGCYGMGVSRLVGAVIEQCHDDAGIIWPEAIAPFEVALVPVNYGKSEAVRTAADALYAELRRAGVDVLLDDRDERPGVKFADMELLGLPHRVVIGDRGLKDGVVEYQSRRGDAGSNLPLDGAVAALLARLRPSA